jgi:large subunit ribosomal protein L2
MALSLLVHIGGGHKQHYRIIDFKRTKDNIPATVGVLNTILTVLRILLLKYADGENVVSIAAKKQVVGDTVMSGELSPTVQVNHLPLKNIPLGTIIISRLKIGKGAQMKARSAGAGVPVARS